MTVTVGSFADIAWEWQTPVSPPGPTSAANRTRLPDQGDEVTFTARGVTPSIGSGGPRAPAPSSDRQIGFKAGDTDLQVVS